MRSAKQLKIVMLAPAYHPSSGGVEKHIRNITRELKALGHTVVILVRYSKTLPKHQTVDGVEVFRLPRIVRYPLIGLWLERHRKLLGDTDVIHSHDFYPWGIRRSFPNVRWIHTFHGYEGYPVPTKAIETRQEIRKQVSYCIGVGAFIEKWYGTRCDLLTYGAASASPAANPKKPQWDMIFVGRLDNDTGFKDYLNGLNIISRERPETTLLVLGDGPLRAWAEQFIADNNLKVTLKGSVKNVESYLPMARVALVSGYLAILEAALAGLPIIAHYGTPIKKDYLEMHPMAKFFHIVNSGEAVSQAYLGLDGKKPAAELTAWAKRQTWRSLAEAYLKAYRSTPNES